MQNQDNSKAQSRKRGPSSSGEDKDENPSKHQANRNEQKDGEEAEEEVHFKEDFRCCICLDLLFKPVVLECGHFACFWCVYNTMNVWYECLCPICRDPFYHFPNVCRLLHFLLLKMYPIAYKRREREVGEEEKEMDHFSPQFDDHLLLSNHCGGFDASSNSLQVPPQPHAQLSSEGRSAGFSNGETENRSLSGKEPGNETQKQVSVVDVLCDECKNLLFRPVVLNCGHVCCESCIINPEEGTPKCQICQTLHPNGFPNVCLALELFLEEYFPKLYSARQEGLPSQDATQAQHQARHSSSVPTRETFADEFMMHGGVGCDSCGMCPIVGQRYKCKDCVEKIGFDLCEACYNNPSKLLGRFNQQHKPEHSFDIVRSCTFRELLYLGEFGQSEDSDDEEDR